MKQLLKLQDHKHTARKLEHAHTSYRGLWLVMIIFGLSLGLISNTVNAESYVVTAGVHAPIPSTAAQITSPVNQTTVTNQNVVITGTCPVITPAIIVTIYNNGLYIGSAGCSSLGIFSGSFTLSYGQNNLVPKILNITNDAGPDGDAVSVSLPVPVNNTPQALNNSSSAAVQPQNNSALNVNTDSHFLIIKPNESLVWRVTIAGGQSPYSITVDWGDGTKSNYAANSAGEQSLEHTFKKAKNTIIRLSVRDSTGKEVFTTVAGITFVPQQHSLISGSIQTTHGSYISLSQLWLIYILIVGLVVLLWLEARHRQLIIVAYRRKRTSRKK